MKTNNFYRALILIALSVINQFSYGQAVNWMTGLTTCNASTNNLLGTSGASVAGYRDINFQTLGAQQMILQNTTGYLGVGAGYVNPTQMVSILGGNFNIAAGTPTYGYMIGDKPVLFTGGDLTSIFVGAQSPVSAAYFLFHGQNSCLGYGVCPNIAYGHSNTLIGGYASILVLLV